MRKKDKIICWDITSNCNYNCSYCFLKKNPQKKDYKKIIKKISKLEGKWRIVITGGEPFACTDFKNIIKDIIKKTRHNLTIITNFSSEADDIIEVINIAKKRLKTMTLSLHLEYSKPKDFLNKIQKIKKYLDKYRISIVVNCVALKEDLKKRAKIGELFKKKGIKFILLPDKNFLNNRNYYSNKDKKIIRKFGQGFGLSSINFKGRMCSAGKDYFVIDEKGDSYKCYSELTFDPKKKSVGSYTDKQFFLLKKIKKCPYKECVCEGPYSMGFVKYNLPDLLRKVYLILIHFPRKILNFCYRLLGKFGIFLKKHNAGLYHKLKRIEKKIRK